MENKDNNPPIVVKDLHKSFGAKKVLDGIEAFGHVVEGWTSLSTLVLVLGSMQLILFGLLGEYVGRLYLEAKRRPLFVIDQVLTQNTLPSDKYRAPREHATVPGEV